MQYVLVPKGTSVTANGSKIARRFPDTGEAQGVPLQFPSIHIHIESITGTSPTIDFTVYDWDKAQEDFVQVAPSTGNLTATGDYDIVIFNTCHQISDTIKLAWTVGGTTPSITFSASVRGIEDTQGGL